MSSSVSIVFRSTSAQPCLLSCTAVQKVWQEEQLAKTSCRPTQAAQVPEVPVKGHGPCLAHAAHPQCHCRSATFPATGQQAAPAATALHPLCQGICRHQSGVSQLSPMECTSSSCFPCCMQRQIAGHCLNIPIMKPSPLVPCRGFAEGVKRVAKQVQGALPLVGLLSRLASPSGGIGRDELVSCRPSSRYRSSTIRTCFDVVLSCLLRSSLTLHADRHQAARICQHDLNPPHMLLTPAGNMNPDRQLQQCLVNI